MDNTDPNNQQSATGFPLIYAGQITPGAITPQILSPSTTPAKGDTYYGDTNNNFTKISVGANGSLYVVSSGVPAWLPGGTVNQVLTMVAGSPAWQTPATSLPSSATTAISADITTASASFVDATGLAVTITVGASGKVLLIFRGSVKDNASDENVDIGYNIGGGSDVAVMTLDLSFASANRTGNASFSTLITGIAAGSKTFQIRWRAGGGTATMRATTFGAEVTVIAL